MCPWASCFANNSLFNDPLDKYIIRYIPFQCCRRGTYMFLTYFLICPDRDILSLRDRQAAQQSLSLISNKFLEIILFIPDSALHVYLSIFLPNTSLAMHVWWREIKKTYIPFASVFLFLYYSVKEFKGLIESCNHLFFDTIKLSFISFPWKFFIHNIHFLIRKFSLYYLFFVCFSFLYKLEISPIFSYSYI